MAILHEQRYHACALIYAILVYNYGLHSNDNGKQVANLHTKNIDASDTEANAHDLEGENYYA